MVNEPCRWTMITSDQSDQLMRWKMRSRRMPALLTRMSTRPKASSAACTILSAFCGSPIESVEAIAWPPAFLISSTTCCAGPASPPEPSSARADVVDHDLRALLRHQHRDGAADAAARAGDDGDFAFDDAWHVTLCPSTHSAVTPGLDPGVHEACRECDLTAVPRGASSWIAGSSPAMTAVRVATHAQTRQLTAPTPRRPPRRSAAASPIARPRSACCPPRSRRSRTGRTGRAGRDR